MDTVTQEDITMFSQMFSKLSNIIVQASEVGQRLPILQSQLDQLNADCETIRKRNQELDEELFNVRNQRDIAQQEARQAQAEASSFRAQADTLALQRDEAISKHMATTQELEAARKERDDYGFRNMELQDQLDKANATLAKFKDLLGNVFPEPKPEPAPTVTEFTPPVVVAEAPPTTKRIFRYVDGVYNNEFDHQHYVNNRPKTWDNETGDYYVEVAA